MSTSHAIRHIRITPIAFRDPPLLNAAGIHEPWALRSIIEIETASGLVGINESYGDQPMLEALAKAAPALVGLCYPCLSRLSPAPLNSSLKA